MRVGPLDRSQLADATAVLAGACVFDRAADVAEEKLFGASPAGVPRAFGAWDGEALVGVAAVGGSRIRVLAVVPAARGRGIGSGLGKTSGGAGILAGGEGNCWQSSASRTKRPR